MTEQGSALVLAGVYALSAVQKGRDIGPFADYLQPLLGAHGRVAGYIVVSAEALIFAILLVSLGYEAGAGVAGAFSATFLTLATLGYSALLARGQVTDCHCFGHLSTSTRINPAMRPALFALRTSVFMLLSVMVLDANLHLAAQLIALVVGVLLAGLLVGIVRERLLLKRSPHPRATEYAGSLERLRSQAWWINGHPRPW